MEQLQQVLADFIALLQAGFHQVNAVQGLVIALVAAILLKSFARLPAITIGATVVHILADMLIPVIAYGSALKLPPLVEGVFWRYVLTLLIGYFVIILFLFVIKRAVFKS
ncbi:MAG: hypothetical protein HXY25_02780 [Alphaproteobacteria bacterium]|nr:hypothetical protein [Alphaproteobacteria bacterium]